MKRWKVNTIFAISAVLLTLWGLCCPCKVCNAPEPDPNHAPVSVLAIAELQDFLTALDEPRYDPNGIDNDPGPQFRKAWNNWAFDQHALYEELK